MKRKYIGNYILGGISVAMGAFIGLYFIFGGESFSLSEILMAAFVCLFMIGGGIFLIIRASKLANGKPEDRETKLDRYLNSRIADLREKERSERRRKPTMAAELNSRFVTSTVVIAIILVPLLFLLAAMWGNLIIGAIGCLVPLCVFIYGLTGAKAGKIKKVIREMGLEYNMVEQDFLGGELFTAFYDTICVGTMFTVYCGEMSQFVVPNAAVLRIYIEDQHTEVYSWGVYGGTVTHPFLVLETDYGMRYRFRCAKSDISRILLEYQSRSRFLREDCRIIFPEEQKTISQK